LGRDLAKPLDLESPRSPGGAQSSKRGWMEVVQMATKKKAAKKKGTKKKAAKK
jgi:hypothetical protein